MAESFKMLLFNKLLEVGSYKAKTEHSLKLKINALLHQIVKITELHKNVRRSAPVRAFYGRGVGGGEFWHSVYAVIKLVFIVLLTVKDFRVKS